MLCEHSEVCNLDIFLRETLPYFDACILIDNARVGVLDVPEGGWPEKILAYLRTPDPNDNKRILLDCAREAGTEWVCFMTSAERIDYRFDRIKDAIDAPSARTLAFYHVLCRDEEHYYDIGDSWNGFIGRPRMYRLTQCSGDEILDPESEPNR